MSEQTDSAAPILEQVLACARRGWPVFPIWPIRNGRCACPQGPSCPHPGKHPLGLLAPHGKDDATTDEDQLAVWWDRWPDANPGIRTGADGGYVVLDVDPRNGGDLSLQALEAKHGRLPDTVEALTGGGGRHIFFRHPGVPMRSRANALGPGLDVKADGGYVVVPPSLHVSGRRYEWEISSDPTTVSLSPLPGWLLGLLMGPTSGGANGRPGAGETDWAALLAGAPEGERRQIALRIAGHFLARGLPPAEVEAILLGYCARCAPPFPEEEARGIVRDLAAKEARARAAGGDPSPREALARGAGGRLRLVRAADVAPARVRWAYRPVLAYGKITLVAGDPDNGKSLAVTDYAARLTCGGTWPDGTAIGEPGTVLFFSAEDDLADTIRPRLEAAGGDPRRLYTAEDVVGPTGKLEMFTLHHVEPLRQALQETGAKLCIIDPTAAYLGKSDSDNDAEMRALLRPVAKLAAELGVIVVVISHLNKAATVKALYRVQGSIALVGAVRLAYVVVHGFGEDAETRYICPLKVNIAKRPLPIAFRISTPADEDEVPRILWDLARQPAHTLEEMLTGEAPPAPARPAREPEGLSVAEAFLARELAQGPVSTADLKKAAEGSGNRWRTVERAKAKAGDRIRADAVGQGTRDARYYWYQAGHQDRMDGLKNAAPGEGSGPPRSRTRGKGGGVADQLQLPDKTHEDSGTSKWSATPPTSPRAREPGGPLPSEPRGRRRRACSVAELLAHREALREHVEAEGQVPFVKGRDFLEARGLAAKDVRFVLTTGAGWGWIEVLPTGGSRMLIPLPRGAALPPVQAGEAPGPAGDTDEDPGF